MRFVIGCLAGLMATSAMADEFDVQSEVTSVLAATSGAIITRGVPVSLTTGMHTLTVYGAPMVETEFGNAIDFPKGSGLSLISASGETALSPEPLYKNTQEYRSLTQALDRARTALHAHQTLETAQRAVVEAAQVRLTFLKNFASGSSSVLSLEQLSDPQFITNLTTQLGSETSKAVSESAEAERKMQDLKEAGVHLTEAFNRAQERLDEIVPEDREELVLTIKVAAEKPFEGNIGLRYLSEYVRWVPVSDVKVEQDADKGAITIAQNAFFQQETDEDWQGVKITLTTADIDQTTGVNLPRSLVKKLYDPSKNSLRKVTTSQSTDIGYLTEPEVMEVEEAAAYSAGSFAGQTQLFTMEQPLAIKSGREAVVLPLQNIDMNVDLYGRARADGDKAYLYADVTNETGGRILPSTASLYRDGQFFGEFEMPELVAGDEYPLQLGLLDGILVDHNIIKKEDGDRGLLSSSQIAESRFETIVTSLLDYDLPFKLYGRMPVSESEDLTVKEYAKPQISEREIDGRRGVVAWYFDMAAGKTQKVEYGYDLSWPSGMALK